MIYSLALITGPTEEPVTTAEVKTHCRISHTADDEYITALITTAREYIEDQTRRQFVTATWEMYLDAFPYWAGQDWRAYYQRYGVIQIPKAPLQAVNSVVYVDTTGATQTLDPSQYQVDAKRWPGRIAPRFTKVWPVTQPITFNAVTINFTAGYGAASAVPAKAAHAIKLLAGHLYENREASQEAALAAIPFGLHSMIRALSTGVYR